MHAIVPATWLSCEHPRQSHAPFGGVTVDQIAARHIGQETPLPSLELATEEEGGGAACDGTYGCSYGRTISFRTPTTPMPMEFDPRKAFEKIFGRGKSDAERRAVSGDYQSLLDMVLAEASALKRTLGGEDRALVDDYLDSVREIERRLELLGQRDLTKIDLPDVPVARPSFDDLIRLQFDLIVAAFQANMTRIASFMMAAEVSNQSYAHVGVPDAFHPVSHHADNKASMEKLVLDPALPHAGVRGLHDEARGIPDGDGGSILDNSIFLYGSNMSNSNQHNQFPLPTLVFGGGAGPSRAISICAIRIARRSRICCSRCCCAPACPSTSRRQHRRAQRGLIGLVARPQCRSREPSAAAAHVKHFFWSPMLVAAALRRRKSCSRRRGRTMRRSRSPRSRTASTSARGRRTARRLCIGPSTTATPRSSSG